jgi:hypothetical protein
LSYAALATVDASAILRLTDGVDAVELVDLDADAVTGL